MRKLSDQQKIEIVEKYLTGKYNCAQLGREYGVHRVTIVKMLKVRNIKIITDVSIIGRTYSINHDYFNKIDTEDKAYFLGFLFADGCNISNAEAISLALEETDKEILEQFSRLISSDYPLKYLNAREIKNKKTGKTYISKPQYLFRITSKNLSQQLTKLGCVPRKSLILQFPTEDQVSEHLIRHFIRGYFDGDGSFTLRKRNNRKDCVTLSTSIVSSRDFCNVLADKIKTYVNINLQISKPSNCSDKTGAVRSTGTQQVYRLLKWLYSDCEIFLKRKYDKFISVENELLRRKLITI